MRSKLFSFPNPVNEVAARLVAGGVVLLSLAGIILQEPWLSAVIAYGFLARVATGPTLSPLALLVTKVVVPRLAAPERPVLGPPKRFAQGIGAVVSVSAAVLWIGFGLQAAGSVALGVLVVAATLESVFALCVGCKLFALLMRVGVIPEGVCEECSDITLRAPPTGSTA